MDEKRIIDLEMKLTHMEDLMDQLNQIVTNQQLTIERLTKDVTDLKLASLGSANQGDRILSNEVPPHY